MSLGSPGSTVPDQTVLGVDFSGAARPGDDVWITTASLAADGDTLVVERLRSAEDALGASGREAVLAGLVDHVRDAAVVGFDFPFGLPRPVVAELGGPATWRETVAWVGREFTDADEFATRCKAATRARTDGERTYLRRVTDDPVGAKSPYHFFTVRQAYHGQTAVLGPLLDRGVAVAPMVADRRDRPTAVEAYPAGTLRRLGLPAERYKDDTEAARTARERILSGLQTSEAAAGAAADPGTPRVVVDESGRSAALDDAGGDALDSLVAAVAAAGAMSRGFAPDESRYDPLEGYVFV